MISEDLAMIFQLDTSDAALIYFVQNPPRVRKFTVKGIYNTSMVDFDELYVLADIKHIQDLNNWDRNKTGGFEITIDNFENLDQITSEINSNISFDLSAESIRTRVPHIFDWLDLQDLWLSVDSRN